MRCIGQDFVKRLFTTLMVVVVSFSFQVTGLDASRGGEFKGSLFGRIDLSLESNKLDLNAGFRLFPRKTFGDGPASVFK